MALDYLPSPGWAVIYGETPSATRWSELGDNDDALAQGTGWDDGIILDRHIPTSTVKRTKIDWSTFDKNIKTATNTAIITPVNGTNVNGSGQGLALSFTNTGTAYAFVTITVGTVSSSDFENKPVIFLNGVATVVASYGAAAGNAISRVNPRTWHALITLPSGTNTISGGINVASATSPSVPVGYASITAIVLGNVTA